LLCWRDRNIVLNRSSVEASVPDHRHRVSIKLYRFLEASAEGPLGILGLLAAVALFANGFALGWW
jgi:hypothetical protein